MQPFSGGLTVGDKHQQHAGIALAREVCSRQIAQAALPGRLPGRSRGRDSSKVKVWYKYK
eukprot:scaffold836_cov123-Isochrysis_galbana.AAC.1